MTEFWYEILLGCAAVAETEWQDFLLNLARLIGAGRSYRLVAQFEGNVLHYYLCSPKALAASVCCQHFLLKPTSQPAIVQKARWRGIHLNQWPDNLAEVQARLATKSAQLQQVDISLRAVQKRLLAQAELVYLAKGKSYAKALFCVAPSKLLSLDFGHAPHLAYKKFPKYLGIEKIVPLLTADSADAWLQPETFPFLADTTFLPLPAVDFAKHSLVLGGSGTGKSKFLAGFIQKLYRTQSEDFQVVVIDPHAALQDDLADIPERTVVNFASTEQSIDLFANHVENINVGVELMLGLFRGLLGGNYNSYLERVLRFSTYLLMSHGDFDFSALRRLLLEVSFRQQILQECQGKVPVNVSQFFLADFQEVKNQHYGEAIAPIIAFVDEMQMVPVFSERSPMVGLDELLKDNFLHIFSLNRLHLGDKVVQTIAGLLFQQLFLAAEQRTDPRQLIVIVDEVAVIENPILARFLSELRKFRVSVVLAGQYFEQVSADLRAAILANTSNYYLFRVSRGDAQILTTHLDIKSPQIKEKTDQPKLLTDLKLRECLVKADVAGEPLPAFKARTLDFACGDFVAAKTIPQKATRAATGSVLVAQFESEPGNDMLSVPFVVTSRKKLI